MYRTGLGPRAKRVPRITPPVSASVLQVDVAAGSPSTVDIALAVPAGVTNGKLLLLSISPEAIVGIVDDNVGTGQSIEACAVEQISNVGTLWMEGYYLDNPTAGVTHTLTVTMADACTPALLAVVLSGTKAGIPVAVTTDAFEGQGTTDGDILLDPEQFSSIAVGLTAANASATFSHGPGQTLLGADSNALYASATYKPDLNRAVTQLYRATASTAVDLVGSVVVLVEPAETVVEGAGAIVSEFEMSGTGASEPDAESGLVSLSLTAPERGVATIAVGGDGSTGFDGSGSFGQVSPPPEWQVPAGAVELYFQYDSEPAASNKYQIANQDSALPPFGWTMEARRNGGDTETSMYSYMRNDVGGTGTAQTVLAEGVQAITADTAAHAMLWWQYDADATQTEVGIYFEQDGGGAAAEVGAITISGGPPSLTKPINLAQYHNGVDRMPGVLQKLTIWSGKPTLAQFAARPAPTSISHSTPTAGAPTVNDITVGTLPGGTTNARTVTATELTGDFTGAQLVTITEVSDSDGVAMVTNNGTTSAAIQIDTPASGASANPFEIVYTLNLDGGTESSEGTISGATAAEDQETYTPFPFVTISNPPLQHPLGGALPSFTANNPRSSSFIDPMGGTEVFRVTGDNGAALMINGNQSSGGITWTNCGPLPANNPRTGDVWNNDATLMYFQEFKDRSGNLGNARSVLFDADASHGNNNPWTVLRAATSGGLGDGPGVITFWDHFNPLRMYWVASDGLYEWWPIGGTGHSTGETNKLLSWPSGYGSFTGGRYNPALTTNGRYYIAKCKRNSDSLWGGFLVDVFTESIDSDFLPCSPSPPFPTPDPTNQNHRLSGTSATGAYGWYDRNGQDVYYQSTVDGSFVKNNTQLMNGRMMTHQDHALIDGVDYVCGHGTYSNAPGSGDSGEGFWIWDIASGNGYRKSSYPAGGNHTGCQSYKDLFETYGGTGSGSSTGIRYMLNSRYSSNGGHPRGIMAVRCGANDFDQIRYLCNHRSTRSDNADECHPGASPAWEYVAFNSDWQEPGVKTSGDRHGYVCIIPDAFRSPNNDGS